MAADQQEEPKSLFSSTEEPHPNSMLHAVFDAITTEMGELTKDLPGSKLFVLAGYLSTQGMDTSKDCIELVKKQFPDDTQSVDALTKDIATFQAARKAFFRLASFMVAIELSSTKEKASQ